VILCIAVASFAIAWVCTLVVRLVAPRIGFVDKPGHRKVHRPRHRSGNHFLGFAVPLPLAVWLVPLRPPGWLGDGRLARPPADISPTCAWVLQQRPMAPGLVGTLLAMPARAPRRPPGDGAFSKLFLQLAIVAAFDGFRRTRPSRSSTSSGSTRAVDRAHGAVDHRHQQRV
jgi:hypothetical protein